MPPPALSAPTETATQPFVTLAMDMQRVPPRWEQSATAWFLASSWDVVTFSATPMTPLPPKPIAAEIAGRQRERALR
ncbi:MAG: hypothetical protein QOF25_3925 [Mycobacterium sp.]|jgi:hypothetical protein|nr:hypothetical protein [Mycobacterium sp.]